MACKSNGFDDDIICSACGHCIFKHQNGNIILNNGNTFFHAVSEGKLFKTIMRAQNEDILTNENGAKLWHMLFEGS